MTIRFTPKGFDVSFLVSAISVSRIAGGMDPEASTPKPPPLEIADTKWRSDTQVMAPPIMARGVPRKAHPCCQRLFNKEWGDIRVRKEGPTAASIPDGRRLQYIF